jgi:H+-transporting ATPase
MAESPREKTRLVLVTRLQSSADAQRQTSVCVPGKLPEGLKPEDSAIFPSVVPEDKFDLVKAFRRNGHTVGMCGDGANEAPALRQAQIGIAVSPATYGAKSAAGAVLTEAGLTGNVALREGRIRKRRAGFQSLPVAGPRLDTITTAVAETLGLSGS